MSEMVIDDREDSLSRASSAYGPMQSWGFNRAEQDTNALAKKVESVGLPLIPLTTPPSFSSLPDRVKEDKPAYTLAQLQEVLLEQPNYLNEIRVTIAKILVQMNRISEKDRTQIDEMKKKYETAYKNSAGLTRQIAWNGLVFSGIALIPLVLHAAPGADAFDREMANAFASQVIPGGGRMWNAAHEADQKKADSLANLLLQEYSAKTAKGSSESSSKQELIGILDKAVSALKEAARAG